MTALSFFSSCVSSQPLSDYNPADMALALMRMISYNIGHLAYLNATRYDIKRVFFGGFFIRGHPYTMETISFAIRFWSKDNMKALFLRHEGFLGAMGAFLKISPIPLSFGESTAAAAAVAARPSGGAEQPEPWMARAGTSEDGRPRALGPSTSTKASCSFFGCGVP